MLGAVRRGVFGRFDVGRGGKVPGGRDSVVCAAPLPAAVDWRGAVGGGGGRFPFTALVSGGQPQRWAEAVWRAAGWRGELRAGGVGCWMAGGSHLRRWWKKNAMSVAVGTGCWGRFLLLSEGWRRFPLCGWRGARRKGAGRRDVQYALLLPLRRGSVGRGGV